jgi:hypothetical protein
MRSNHIFGQAIGVVAVFALAIATNAGAESVSPERSIISPERVIRALGQAGLSAKAGDVEFLSSVSSVAQNPQLSVVNVSRWRRDDLKVRLRCRSNRECLPFYVVLRNANAKKIPDNLLAAAQTNSVPEQKPLRKPAEKPLVRGGQRATLVLKNHDLRITIPVICLENGARGEVIRLSSPDRKQKYAGEVVAAGLLQGDYLDHF